MYNGARVGVVVPAYNETGFVGEVIDTIPEFVDRVYPVDDCSTDETWAEICAHARRSNDAGRPFPDGDERELRWAESEAESSNRPFETDEPNAEGRVVPLRHVENRGVGAAIKTGYRRAREDGMDVVAVMAGDGQMDPDPLARILDPVVEGRADYAKGNRLHSKASRREMSRWRLFGNSLLTALTKVASGYWKMVDSQNGYTAISREALSALDLGPMFDGYGYTNTMLVHLNVADRRIADVPMPARYGDEDSDIRYSSFVPQLSALLVRGFGWRLKQKYLLRDFHPLAFLYGLGAIATVGGLYASVRERATGDGRGGPTTALLGLVAVVLAMTFDLYENEDLYVQTESGEGDE